MNNTISNNEVSSHVKEILLRMRQMERDEQYLSAVQDGLKQIADAFSTDTYEFNLATELFVENAPAKYTGILASILEEYRGVQDINPECGDIVFVAYYALSLIYKKENRLDLLESLTSPDFNVLNSYPLRFEVLSRYYKRIGDLRKALNYDKLAVNILVAKNVKNLAVCISYASTVCSILSEGGTASSEEIQTSWEYIEDAILRNPQYPKYYFLKARLAFYRALLSDPDLIELEAVVRDATELIEQAEVKLFTYYNGRNRFYCEEQEKYDTFKAQMSTILAHKRAPRFPKKPRELDQLKAEILKTSEQDVCASSSFLPPIPRFMDDDTYFFVCYSSKDFKSVYCDLIELYKRKAPFRYDERMKHGVDWELQIERWVGSPRCLGVVFFISNNIFRDSIFAEMEIVSKYKKPYFCVNLEGNVPPSKLLIDMLIRRYENQPNDYALPGKKMMQFLEFFRDEAVFLHKFREFGDDGTLHLDAFVDAVSKSFPEIKVGD